MKIATKGDGYIVVDEEGFEYGPQVSTKEEAKQLLKDWEAYYGNGKETKESGSVPKKSGKA